MRRLKICIERPTLIFGLRERKKGGEFVERWPERKKMTGITWLDKITPRVGHVTLI